MVDSLFRNCIILDTGLHNQLPLGASTQQDIGSQRWLVPAQDVDVLALEPLAAQGAAAGVAAARWWVTVSCVVG